jgi:hypothetical protein
MFTRSCRASPCVLVFTNEGYRPPALCELDERIVTVNVTLQAFPKRLIRRFQEKRLLYSMYNDRKTFNNLLSPRKSSLRFSYLETKA